jgi:ligand-binding sensor domain-containing protein
VDCHPVRPQPNDRSWGTFTTFTSKDGLPDNAVEAILEDDQGSLWLATHNGLSQFRPLNPQDRASLSHDKVNAIQGRSS